MSTDMRRPARPPARDDYYPVGGPNAGNASDAEKVAGRSYATEYTEDDASTHGARSYNSHARLNTQPMMHYPPSSEGTTPGVEGLPGGVSPRHGGPRWGTPDFMKKLEHGFEEFDPRNASEAHLVFAEGDVPKSKLSRVYNYLLNVSIITRWFLFIVPILGIIWIPGILGITRFPNGRIWGVKLIWWSIWLSIVWGGWWAALATARMFPKVLRGTVGVVAVSSRKYVDWLDVLHRYVAFAAWMAAVFVSWLPIINRNQEDNNSTNNKDIISLAQKLWFALFLCAIILLFEKLSIQWIAGKFHEKSYAERIGEQKYAVHTLVLLYRYSIDIPGRSDTMRAEHFQKEQHFQFIKNALKSVKSATTTTATAFGNVASEIAGTSVLQPNSPQAMVKTALESANKSRQLARRLYYSFVHSGAHHMVVEDIARFFPTPEAAAKAFALFDKDGNGDATRDEVEMALMELHREQLSIEHSMRDLDSAVGRLDNILMSVYVVVAALIIAVSLEAQLTTLITGAGTLILGLSWLIGASMQEVLSSIIFLFIKHPFDVGDRVDIDTDSFTVKEIMLLSTVFVASNGGVVQAPNIVLNTKLIRNLRRSGQMSESFVFDVNYGTTFEQLEALRAKMLVFLQDERRDFEPAFDVTVVDFPDQGSMTLSADIKYKSNWQQGALKAKRRNKWICKLKICLAECEIFGPKGDPAALPPPAKYTTVPYEDVLAAEEKAAREAAAMKRAKLASHAAGSSGSQLIDKKTVITEDAENVFADPNDSSNNLGNARPPPLVSPSPATPNQYPIIAPPPNAYQQSPGHPGMRGPQGPPPTRPTPGPSLNVIPPTSQRETFELAAMDAQTQQPL